MFGPRSLRHHRTSHSNGPLWGLGGLVWLTAASFFACSPGSAPPLPEEKPLGGAGGDSLPPPPPETSGGRGGEGGLVEPHVATCPAGTFAPDPDDPLACLALTACRPGEYVAAEGGGVDDRECRACPRGTFSDSMNAAECEEYTTCEPGSFVLEAGTKTDDQVCELCEEGTFSSANNQTSCEECPEGGYSAEAGAEECRSWTRCGFSEGVKVAGTSVSDVICEVASASRQLGTAEDDVAAGMAIDAEGNIFVVGNTSGLLGASSAGKSDGFVKKLDASGQELWILQFGSSEPDVLTAVALDAAGNAYITGFTLGALPGQDHLGASDAFLLKITGAGSVVWMRQFGTSMIESAQGLFVTAAGEAYVAGSTFGALGDQENTGGGDAFVAKFDGSGEMRWAHLLGQAKFDEAIGVGVNEAGEVYLTGNLDGELPNTDAFGGVDVFLRKLDVDGFEIWTEQFGSSLSDEAKGLVVDEQDNVVVVGAVGAALPGKKSAGGKDWFLRRYRADGSALTTVQGGSQSDDAALSVAFDGVGNLVVGGTVEGALPEQEAFGGVDGFVGVWTRDLAEELGLKQLGSSKNDSVVAVSPYGEGTLLVAGTTFGQLPGQPRFGKSDVYLTQVALP